MAATINLLVQCPRRNGHHSRVKFVVILRSVPRGGKAPLRRFFVVALLYQIVRTSDRQSINVSTLSAGGYADGAKQKAFCGTEDDVPTAAPGDAASPIAIA